MRGVTFCTQWQTYTYCAERSVTEPRKIAYLNHDSSELLNFGWGYAPDPAVAAEAHFHLLRHVTTRQARRVVTCRACCSVLNCSNMADDEEIVLACKTISYFLIIYYFSSQIKLTRLLKRITAIITLHTLQTN